MKPITTINRTNIFVLCAALLTFPLAIHAQEGTRLSPSEIKWPGGRATGGVGTSGASGIQTVVLQGDPSKPGLYTIRLRIAGSMKIQAHSHPDERSAEVVSGNWYIGYGHQFDEKALKELPPGSFYTEPAGADHFAMTKGEVIVQITGYGPSATKYFDPANDPAKKK